MDSFAGGIEAGASGKNVHKQVNYAIKISFDDQGQLR
jgi:DUF971 family protein